MDCFVIMPFGDRNRDLVSFRQFDHIYREWIKPTVEGVTARDGTPLRCHRADMDHRPGEIIPQVVEALAQSEVVIADLTGRSANVFYELGVRHALHDNTVILAQEIDDIPFDLRGMRAIPYQYDPESLVELRSRLQATLNSVLSEAIHNDNPVRRYLYQTRTEQLLATGDAATKEILSQLRQDLDKARQDFTEQLTEVRALAEAATRYPDRSVKLDVGYLTRFEGAWASIESFPWMVSDVSTHFYAKYVDGELRVAYCLSGNSQLTGHFYNLQSFGGRLIGRFRWFDGPFEGCVVLREVARDRLEGGWWFLNEIPKHLQQDLSGVYETLPGMNRVVFVRLRDTHPVPPWATEYFRRIATKQSQT